jgi:hypothetical protein
MGQHHGCSIGTSASLAYVRIDKRNGDASKEKVPLSVSIDLDDGRTLVLYPTKKADKIVYWSQGPSMNAVSSNRAATEISTGDADHNSAGDDRRMRSEDWYESELMGSLLPTQRSQGVLRLTVTIQETALLPRLCSSTSRLRE